MTESDTGMKSGKKLARSRDDRYIGGVAAGIAHRFSIDPMLVRIAFVISLVFGGIGALAYLILLVTLPIDGDPDQSIPPVPESRRMAVIVGTVVLGLICLITRDTGNWLFGIGSAPLFIIFFWGAVIVGLIWMIREGTRSNSSAAFSDSPSPSAAPSPSQTAPTRVDPAEAPTEVTDPATADTVLTDAPLPPATATAGGAKTTMTSPRVQSQELADQQERSGGAVIGQIMTWFAIGLAALVGLTILAGISAWVTVISGAIPMATVVVAIGIGMVVCAVSGRRNIAIWLLPVALFIAIPMAALSLAGIRVHGSFGDLNERPVVAAEIPSDGYELAVGQMTIDMRRFDFQPGKTVELPVDSGLGYTQVIVPDDVCVTADITGKAGLADIRGTRSSGVDITRTIAATPTVAPVLDLDADFQLGFLQVVDATAYETHNYIGEQNYENGRHGDSINENDRKAVARAEAACAATSLSGSAGKDGSAPAKPDSKKSTVDTGDTTKS